MKTTWLILDCDYLCYRIHFGMRGKELSTEAGERTEILYAFLRDLLFFQRLHNTKRVVFCFDSRTKKRKELYQPYKDNRKKIEDFEETRKQIRILKNSLLREIGYRNILFQKGYEADDMVAAACKSLPKSHRAIIIAADEDFFQLLRKNVRIWTPRTREIVTVSTFKKQYGIKPSQWATVKAIAGCVSDNVAGVQGVGESTAAKYLRGEMPESSLLRKRIEASGDLIERNLRLVKLPFEGTKEVRLKHDVISQKTWGQVTTLLQMETIADSPIALKGK